MGAANATLKRLKSTMTLDILVLFLLSRKSVVLSAKLGAFVRFWYASSTWESTSNPATLAEEAASPKAKGSYQVIGTNGRVRSFTALRSVVELENLSSQGCEVNAEKLPIYSHLPRWCHTSHPWWQNLMSHLPRCEFPNIKTTPCRCQCCVVQKKCKRVRNVAQSHPWTSR